MLSCELLPQHFFIDQCDHMFVLIDACKSCGQPLPLNSSLQSECSLSAGTTYPEESHESSMESQESSSENKVGNSNSSISPTSCKSKAKAICKHGYKTNKFYDCYFILMAVYWPQFRWQFSCRYNQESCSVCLNVSLQRRWSARINIMLWEHV